MEALLGRLEAIKSELNLDVKILGAEPNARIPGLKGPRANCTQEGIIDADVIMVPLEDGDRCEALVAMGKTVIVIDLNPLSRSAKMGSITIVDELTRVAQNMLDLVQTEQPLETESPFDNNKNLAEALRHIVTRFSASRQKTIEVQSELFTSLATNLDVMLSPTAEQEELAPKVVGEPFAIPKVISNTLID